MQLILLQEDIRCLYETLNKRLKQVARYILDHGNSMTVDNVDLSHNRPMCHLLL